MKAVVENLRFKACQGIAQRGHREGESSHNLENFRELLHVATATLGLTDRERR